MRIDLASGVLSGEVQTTDDEVPSVSRTVTPRIDPQRLARLLEMERSVAEYARRRR